MFTNGFGLYVSAALRTPFDLLVFNALPIPEQVVKFIKLYIKKERLSI
jgi:hypothetical protein